MSESDTSGQSGPAEDDEVAVTNFGFLNFTIVPGFKRIRMDRESTIGFSENILVTAGTHWVEITSPKGYADSSFNISVKGGESIKKVIRLRNVVSGEIADMPIQTGQPPPESFKLGWKGYTQIGSFLLGAVASFVAYTLEQRAADARERYETTGAYSPEEYEVIWAELRDAIRARNGMIAVSALSVSVGLVLFAF